MVKAGDEVVFPDSGQRIIFRQTAADTAGALLEVESVLPVGSERPMPHYHPQQEEHFTVLSGTVRVSLGGEERIYGSGESFVVPAGVVHEMNNGGDEEARINWQIRPALRTAEFFLAVPRVLANPELMGAALAEFAPEMRIVGMPQLA